MDACIRKGELMTPDRIAEIKALIEKNEDMATAEMIGQNVDRAALHSHSAEALAELMAALTCNT